MKKNEIVSAISEDFAKAYPAFSGFVRSGFVWDYCMEAVQDLPLINRIIAENNIGVPPAKVFVDANPRIGWQLKGRENQEIGAFWGFVFQNVFHYPEVKEVPVEVANTMKSAAVFIGLNRVVTVEE